MVTNQKVKVIYNPRAGQKRQLLKTQVATSLEEIKSLLKQYQISADFSPTKSAGHATVLAQNAKKEGYRTVIAAGGDGTVGEVANGLINTDLTLGILPLGSFMNIALMLSIPSDMEKAVCLIKINRTRKIDVGQIIRINGEKIDTPFYFLEGAGIGLEAELHEYTAQWEKVLHNPIKSVRIIWRMVQTFFHWYGHRPEIILDDKKIKEWVNMVAISNGPMRGANLNLGPKAKLNDHRLTVSLHKMSKFELFLFYLKSLRKTIHPKKVITYKSKRVRIITRHKRLVHADGRMFGETPVEFRIVPNALNVITGFPTDGDNTLLSRTYLDP